MSQTRHSALHVCWLHPDSSNGKWIQACPGDAVWCRAPIQGPCLEKPSVRGFLLPSSLRKNRRSRCDPNTLANTGHMFSKCILAKSSKNKYTAYTHYWVLYFNFHLNQSEHPRKQTNASNQSENRPLKILSIHHSVVTPYCWCTNKLLIIMPGGCLSGRTSSTANHREDQ